MEVKMRTIRRWQRCLGWAGSGWAMIILAAALHWVTLNMGTRTSAPLSCWSGDDLANNHNQNIKAMSHGPGPRRHVCNVSRPVLCPVSGRRGEFANVRHECQCPSWKVLNTAATDIPLIDQWVQMFCYNFWTSPFHSNMEQQDIYTSPEVTTGF